MAKEKPKKLAKKPAAAAPTNKSSVAKQQEEPVQSAILQDARFQHLVADPRFKKLPQTQRKVKIDKRFQGMFTDDKFNVKYQVDKYGLRINKSNAEDLRKYYELESGGSGSSDEEDAAAIEEEQRKEEKAITRGSDESDLESAEHDEAVGSDENDELQSDTDVPQSLKERLLDPDIDYARGEGRLMTDSSSDDESSEDEDPELLIDHVWGELDNEAETTEDSTNRLAVCNMDWDRIRAADLMVLFSSFLPPGGSILSVTIYPSQFGKERMAEEDKYGPIELQGLGKADKPKEVGQKAELAASESSDDDEDEELVKAVDSDVEEGDDYHMEKLREYQLNRLRYYYAVVICDSVATADKIYKECDGIEYESSATRVDLRFIPDETSFDDDEPTDKCTELPDASQYQPRQFTTTALQQAKVDLTWDETAVERRELGDKLASGKLDEIDDKELRKIVAYSSEEDEEEEEEVAKEAKEKKETEIKQQPKKDKPTAVSKKPKKDDAINNYKALLAEINEKEKQEKQKKYEMEFTWNVEETKAAEKDDKDQEALEKESKSKLTPIERVLQKRSEKNKKRKEERKKKKLQAKGIDPDNYNSDEDSDSIPDGIDMNDPYFAEEFQDGEFVKPTTKTKTKKQKQQENGEQDDEVEKQAKELALLVDDDDEEDGKQHFSLEKIMKAEQETKSKKKRRKQLKKSKSSIADERKEIEDNFQLNLNDQRFQAVYKSPLFNIDPTASHFKKTKGMEQLIQEKLKRRHGDGADEKGTSSNSNGVAAENGDELASKRPKKQLENTLLIKSLKRKIQMKQQMK